MLRPITTLVFLLVAVFTVATLTQYFNIPSAFDMSTEYSTWSSQYSGYFERAQKYPDPHAFQPERSNLRLAVLRNAPVEQEGFTLALFADRVAVDHYGRVFTLTDNDFNGILHLATQSTSLPPTGNFRNMWRIKQERTSYPIDRILVPKSTLGASLADNYEEEYAEVSVYGFDQKRRELQEPVDGVEELPSPLFELNGLAWEARSTEGEEKDDLVLGRVRSILSNAFWYVSLMFSSYHSLANQFCFRSWFRPPQTSSYTSTNTVPANSKNKTTK